MNFIKLSIIGKSLFTKNKVALCSYDVVIIFYAVYLLGLKCSWKCTSCNVNNKDVGVGEMFVCRPL